MAGGLAGLAFVPGGYDTTGNQVENLIANFNKNQGLAALGRYFQSLENQQLPPASLPSDIGGGARSTSSFGPSTFGRGGQSAVNREAAAVNAGTWAPTPDYEAGVALAQSSLQNPPAGGPTLGGAPGAPYSAIMGTPAPGVGAGTGPSPQLLEKYREAQAKYPRIPIRGESAGGMQPTPPPPQPGQPTVPGTPTQPGQPTGAAVFTSPPTPGAFRSPRVSREIPTAAEGPPTFQSLAAAIVKANPGIDPAVLASAVQLASPLMRTDSQMWYRMLQAELKQEALQQQLNLANTREGNRMLLEQMREGSRERVAEVGAESRKDVARIGAESRERVAGENITSREKISGANIESRENIAGANRASREGIAAAGRESREGIAAAGREQRASQFKQSLEFKQQALDRNLAARQQLQDQRIAAAQERAKAGQASEEDVRSLGKAVANYELNPATVNYRQRNAVLAEAKRVNPDWSQANWTATNQGITRFTTGQQGDAVRYLNVAENHLQTLEPLINLLGTGDVRSINSVINYINKNWGAQTGVTNFETARHFVASEVSRAAIGARGALGDRAAAEEPLVANAPVQQLKGTITTYRKLMKGQLQGLESEWNAIPGAPKNFKERFNVSASDLSESKDRFKGFEIIETAPPR